MMSECLTSEKSDPVASYSAAISRMCACGRLGSKFRCKFCAEMYFCSAACGRRYYPDHRQKCESRACLTPCPPACNSQHPVYVCRITDDEQLRIRKRVPRMPLLTSRQNQVFAPVNATHVARVDFHSVEWSSTSDTFARRWAHFSIVHEVEDVLGRFGTFDRASECKQERTRIRNSKRGRSRSRSRSPHEDSSDSSADAGAAAAAGKSDDDDAQSCASTVVVVKPPRRRMEKKSKVSSAKDDVAAHLLLGKHQPDATSSRSALSFTDDDKHQESESSCQEQTDETKLRWSREKIKARWIAKVNSCRDEEWNPEKHIAGFSQEWSPTGNPAQDGLVIIALLHYRTKERVIEWINGFTL